MATGTKHAFHPQLTRTRLGKRSAPQRKFRRGLPLPEKQRHQWEQLFVGNIQRTNPEAAHEPQPGDGNHRPQKASSRHGQVASHSRILVNVDDPQTSSGPKNSRSIWAVANLNRIPGSKGRWLPTGVQRTTSRSLRPSTTPCKIQNRLKRRCRLESEVSCT